MKRPLIYALVAFIAAILMAFFDAPFFLILLIPLILMPLPFVFKSFKIDMVLLVIGVYFVGCVVSINHFGTESPLTGLFEKERQITGVVDSIPTIKNGKTSFILKLKTLDGQPIKTKLQVTVADGHDFDPGKVLNFKGEVTEPSGKRNPGGFDYGLYLDSKGVKGQVYLKDGDDIAISEGAFSPVYRIYALNRQLSAVCDQAFTSEQSGLIKGILLGDTSMDDQIKTDFRNAGVSHILSVSGLHVGYVYAVVLALLGLFKVKRKYRFWILLPCLLVYVALTGFSATVIRAALMFMVLVAGQEMKETYDPLNALCLAGIGLLLLQPAQLFTAGFQLSFTAVLGIVIFCKPLCYLYEKKIKTPGIIVESLILTLSVTLATLPASLYHFQTLNLTALISNLIVVPLSGALLICALVTVPLMAMLPGLIGIVHLPAAFLADSILFLTGFFAKLNWLSLHRGGLVFAELLLLVILAFLFSGYFNLKKKSAKIFVGASLPFLILALCGASLVPKPLTITYLDVGQGDSALIQTPSGGAYLIDGGGYETYGDAPQPEHMPISESVLMPALYAKNITALDGVFISHNHKDHAQGVEELLSQIPIAHLYVSSKYNNEAILKQDKIPVTQLGEGSTLRSKDGLEMTVYWPDTKIQAMEDDEQNEVSMLLGLCYGKRTFLFTGDAGFETEEQILKKIPECDVLKIGHHGSKYATSDEFLKKTNPTLAVISVGRYNSFGHPTNEVLTKIEAQGVKCRRTDQNGAVEVTTDGTNLKVKQYIH